MAWPALCPHRLLVSVDLRFGLFFRKEDHVRADMALECERRVVRRGIQLFGWQRMLFAIWTMPDYASRLSRHASNESSL